MNAEVARVRHVSSARINPRHPQGSLHYDPLGVAYIVDIVGNRPDRHRSRVRWVVTSHKPLCGWEMNAKVTAFLVNKYALIIRGIADFGASVYEGEVPNIPLTQWITEQK